MGYPDWQAASFPDKRKRQKCWRVPWDEDDARPSDDAATITIPAFNTTAIALFDRCFV